MDNRLNKKNFFLLIFSLSVLFFFLSPLYVAAESTGLIPCGGTGQPPCELCHFFVLLERIIKFIWFTLIPSVAVLLLVIGGIMFYLAVGDPSKLNQAKSLFSSVIIGLIIVYGAWYLVNMFFLMIGVAEWTGLEQGWFQYPFVEICP